jgi:hypothetical protein
MITTAPEETLEQFHLVPPLTLEDLEREGHRLLTSLKHFMEALEEIATFPCASDLPLCHNPGCASCRARRALADPAAGGEILPSIPG